MLRGHRIEPAVVAIPLDVTSDGEILLLSMLINITPGSVTIDLSEDRRTLYVHVMHMRSADETRREIKQDSNAASSCCSDSKKDGIPCSHSSRRSRS